MAKIIYNRDTDDVNKIALKKGYYTFIFSKVNLPDTITPGKLPKVTHVLGKKAVIRDIRIDREQDKVYVDLWLAENPVVLIYVIYVLGGALLAWGIAATVGSLETILVETFNPKNLILLLLIIVAINFKNISKAFK